MSVQTLESVHFDTQSQPRIDEQRAIKRWGIAALLPEEGYKERPFSNGAVGYACARLVIEGNPIYDSRIKPDGGVENDKPSTDFRGNILVVPRFETDTTRHILNRCLGVTLTTNRMATQRGVRHITTTSPPLNWDANLPSDQALTLGLRDRIVDGVQYDYYVSEHSQEEPGAKIFEIGDIAARTMFRLEIPDNA